jgi:hypothetical protein
VCDNSINVLFQVRDSQTSACTLNLHRSRHKPG